ncbi:hypothetical protein [Micromonospora sp. NPDC049679]|uniref:hypothetical protein n=1 Tax=Micromonospora sp. NPDC049679 TaxID=3155920 RepID=UPI0033DBC8CD
MRRTLAVLTLAGALAVAGGCGTKSEPKAAPAATSAAPSPTPSEDYTADTKEVCGKIDTLLDKDIVPFAEALAKTVVYREAGNTAQAKKAKATGQAELKKLAAKIRTATAAAKDPKVQEGGEEAATNVEASATSGKIFDTMKAKDLEDESKTLENEMTAWFVPLGVHCG